MSEEFTPHPLRGRVLGEVHARPFAPVETPRRILHFAFMTDEDGEMYLYTSFTEEQLEAQPEYDEATFADARDEQLLVNPAN